MRHRYPRSLACALCALIPWGCANADMGSDPPADAADADVNGLDAGPLIDAGAGMDGGELTDSAVDAPDAGDDAALPDAGIDAGPPDACTPATCDALPTVECGLADDGCGGTLDCGGCDDGSVCNGVEVCFGNACRPGMPIDCDDADACTVDACELDGSCSHAPLADGSACGAGGSCRSGSCCETCFDAAGRCQPPGVRIACGSGGSACVSCDDSDPCTLDSCASGSCTHRPAPDGVRCATGTCMMGACTACGSEGMTCCAGPSPCHPGFGCSRRGTCECGAIGETCCSPPAAPCDTYTFPDGTMYTPTCDPAMRRCLG